MYTVDLYNNTGYNVENIPDSAALLGTPSISKAAVDTIQNYVMSSVRISAVFDDVKNADYCKIGGFYYFVTGVTMTSRDVAVITLIPDYITSYGLSNLDFLDGVTVRHHVDSDDFGAYPEDDPLLFCDQPLKLEVGTPLFDDGTGSDAGDYTIVTSTASLSEMGAGTNFESVTYQDATGTGHEVTVPHLKPAAWSTYFECGAGDKRYTIPGQAAFLISDDANGEVVLTGIQYCRDIAAETAITGQYRIPKIYARTATASDMGITIPSWWPTLPVNAIFGLIGRHSSAASNLDYEYDTTVKNKRVLYGEFCKYGFITRTGNKMEAKPEEIIEQGATSPSILMTADPRPDGRPYYRFRAINGQTPVTGQGTFDSSFWRNAIPGEQWAQIPLVFTSPSGVIQQQKYYDASLTQAQNINTQIRAGRSASDVARIGSGLMSFAGFASGVPTRQMTSHMGSIKANGMPVYYHYNRWSDPSLGTNGLTSDQVSGALGSAANMINRKVDRNIQDQQYNFERGQAAYELGLFKNVVIPDVMFPYTSGSIRDFVGNGVLVYRYRPSAIDLQIQDKLLTMYGYRDSEILNQSHFFNRQYFNYVQANNISIGNNLPQWWKAGIVAQLADGVRVWHVTPDETHYDNNPIVVNP